MTSLKDIQRGYEAWAAKPHNAKWVRKIDGTPIANDIVVTIFNTLRDINDEAEALPFPNNARIIAAFEAAYPELYYHVAKGKITAGEPLYGAIITTLGGTEIGHGESDISADTAFSIAVASARAALSTAKEGE